MSLEGRTSCFHCGPANSRNRRKPGSRSDYPKSVQAVSRSYQSIVDRFDIGTTASAGSGSMSRSQSSHRSRSSASRSGCFFERSPRSRGSYSMSNRYSLSTTFRYFQPLRRTAPLVAVAHAPIERAFEFCRPAGQYRQQIDPVERVAGGGSSSGRSEAGCGQVHRDAHLIGYAPRLDTAGPAADLRYP